MARKLERLDAKRLYLEELKEIDEIAKILNVPEGTIRRWKVEDKENGSDWDREREEVRLTSFSVVKKMLRTAVLRMGQMMDEIQKEHKINPSEVYALRQLLKSAKELEKDVDKLGNILLAMEEFTDFLANRAPDLLQKLHPFLIEFGNEMSRKHGRKR